MLFEPLTINGKITVPNRIVLAPLYLALDGRSDEFRAFYIRRAQGGVGLVVAPQSTPGGIDDWSDPGLGAAFRPLVDGCHAAGARIALQVFSGSSNSEYGSEAWREGCSGAWQGRRKGTKCGPGGHWEGELGCANCEWGRGWLLGACGLEFEQWGAAAYVMRGCRTTSMNRDRCPSQTAGQGRAVDT